MDRKTLLYVAVLCVAIGLGSGQMSENMISSSSYHVCDHIVITNVSKVVAFQKPREEKTLCMGWIPWKLCSRTYYQTEYQTIYVPETTSVKRCCEGYELVGHYCAMTTERSRAFTSRPGKCPDINKRDPGSKCTLDYDCPGFQKCCMSSNGSFCASPAPLAGDKNTVMYWYNGTITIKMAFYELIRLDEGFVNHTRLLHSMVTGELWPLEAAVYHISTKPARTFTILSQILIGFNESHSLPDITMTLSRIVTRLPEVIDIQIEDVDECLHPELGGCSPHQRCTNLVGSYNCSNEHIPDSIQPPPTRPDNISGPSPPHPPGSGRPSTTNALKVDTVTPPRYCSTFHNHSVSNVTSSGFQIHWTMDCPEHHTYKIEIWTSTGFHSSNTTSGTSMNITGLHAGVLYTVRVTFQDCSLVQSWEERVKTEAKVLQVTLKIKNLVPTETLLNPNSSEHAEFVKKFVSEVKTSLIDITPERVTVEVKSLRSGSIIVDFQLILDDYESPSNVTATSFSAFSKEFMVDPKSIVITDFNECLSPADNDCHLHADCRNLEKSYTCQCHSSFFDRDPSRPGRSCEGMVTLSSTPSSTSLGPSSPSMPPIASNDSRNEIYSKNPIDTSPPTSPTDTSPPTSPIDMSPPTSPIATSPPTSPTDTSPPTSPTDRSPATSPIDRSPPTSAIDRSPPTSPIDRSPPTSPTDTSPPTISSSTIYTTNVTAQAVGTSTVLQEPGSPANQVASIVAPVSGDPSTNQSVLRTPVTLTTEPATPATVNTTLQDQFLSTTHRNILNTTDSKDHSTIVKKNSTDISSTVHSVTEHGTVHSSTNDKGTVPLLSLTTKQATSSEIPCAFAMMSTDSVVESTNTPFLLSPRTTTTTQRISPSLTLKDASKVICEIGKIGIAIQKSFLKIMSITSHSLFLGSPECALNCSTDTFILIKAGWKDCKTNVLNTQTQIVVNSTLYISLSSSFQNMAPLAISSISCVFHNDILWSSEYNPGGGFYTIIEKLEGGGSFFPEFQLFIGDRPISSNFTLSATDDITVLIRINTEESQFKVVINECWATPTNDSNDPASIPFIKDSCALANTFTIIHMNGISKNATFQTKIFSYVPSPIVYLHCRLHVCKEEPPKICKPTCSIFRSGNSGENVFTGVTRMGPLTRASIPHNTALPSKATLGPGYIALIIIGVLALVAIVVAILVCWHERRTGNYNFKLKTQDVGYQVFSN